MNQAAIIFGLIITAVISVGAYQTLLPSVNTAENSSMEGELLNVVTAAINYRNTNRNNTSAFDGTMENLTENGYLDSNLYSDGDGESVINTDITATIKAPGTESSLTYDAGDDESCNFLQQRAEAGRIPNLKTADDKVSCANSVLTVTLKD